MVYDIDYQPLLLKHCKKNVKIWITDLTGVIYSDFIICQGKLKKYSLISILSRSRLIEAVFYYA